MHVLQSNRLFCAIVAGILLIAATASPVHSSIIFSATHGNLGASVSFEQTEDMLVVTLTNTSAADVLVPADVLTGVFFDLAGNPQLSALSAIIGLGSTLNWGEAGDGNSLGSQWAYVGNISNTRVANQGISASGLGIFGPHDVFPGGPGVGNGPQGLDFGLLSAGDDLATGNNQVTGRVPLVKDSMVLTLNGLPEDFILTPQSISNVAFQYGTDLSEPRFNAPPADVPEPMTMSLIVLGAGLLLCKRSTIR